MSPASPQAQSGRRLLFLLLGVVGATLGAGAALVGVLATGGSARVEAAATQDEQGRAAIVFTNHGTRAGFLCVWVNVTCQGSAKQTAHLCSDQVAPARRSTRSTRIPVRGRAGCKVDFLADDVDNN